MRTRFHAQLEPKALADVARKVDVSFQSPQRGRRHARVRVPGPARDYKDDPGLAAPLARICRHFRPTLQLRLNCHAPVTQVSSAKLGSPKGGLPPRPEVFGAPNVRHDAPADAF